MYNKRNAGALIISCFVAVSALAGCGNSNAGGTAASTSAPAQTTTTAADTKKSDTAAPDNTESAKPLKVVTTIFPEYDWVKQIMGDKAANAEITYLLESGIDLHNYQPTADDIIKISDCDLFVYVGGESDGWVEDAVAGAVNKDMKVINLMETMGDKAKLEEVKEGMQHDHDHEHGHEEEIEAEDIKDRTLAEFGGEWKSLLPILNAGDLDGFLAEEAEEHGEPVDEVRGEYAEKWECSAVEIKVDGSTITFTFDDGTTASAEYAYAGYSTVLADDGDIKGVRYQFETESADAPRYVQFNDHGHEPADEVEHFHVYFGSDSFDALMSSSANPFFVQKDMSVDEIVEELEGHGHNHEHDHSKEVSTFEDDQVRDRSLSDWEGEWQSAYPLVLDGSLDEAWEHKAEDGSMTAEEYKDYYTKGYKSDYSAISIHGNHISFTDNAGNKTESDYEYTGYFIQNWSTGTKAAMYRFVATDKESGAPVYIEFNDHMIEPEKAEHFHIRMSNESFDAIVDPEGNWPTFFDAALSPEGVCEEVIGHDHHDDDEEEEQHDHDHEHEEEYDEHVWLSLVNTKFLCGEITDALCEIDSANADTYKANYAAYSGELDALHSDFQKLIDSASIKTVVFGDRFPFRYFVDDYGLDYFAAFSGCSAETEASFETVVFLTQKMDELGCKTIYTIENSDKSIAQTIIGSTQAKDQTVAELNSLQSVSRADIDGGATYLSLMRGNYDVLAETLK